MCVRVLHLGGFETRVANPPLFLTAETTYWVVEDEEDANEQFQMLVDDNVAFEVDNENEKGQTLLERLLTECGSYGSNEDVIDLLLQCMYSLYHNFDVLKNIEPKECLKNMYRRQAMCQE